MSDADTPVLAVDSAIHGRIRMALPALLSVGRSMSSDLVLADPSVAGHHLRIRADGAVDVEAVDQPVLFDDGQELAPGQVRTVRSSCAFRAGTVPMHLELPAPALPATPPRKARSWVMLAVPAVVLAASAAYAMTGHALPDRQPAADIAAGAPRAAARQAADVRQAILDDLASRHLSAVSLEVLPDGSHRASGTIAPDGAQAWHDAKLWVDATFGGSVVLVDAVATAAPAPPLSVQSAWLGEAPYVIDGGGEKLFTGAAVAGGWVIEGIEAGRVLLRRQNQRLVVRF